VSLSFIIVISSADNFVQFYTTVFTFDAVPLYEAVLPP
jgi:hypothetical protein